jgi:hypothetical protein
MTAWKVISGESEAGDGVTHIIPAEDIREHTLRGDCWCDPRLDYEDRIATHNSADGREQFETGQRKPT